MGFEPRALRDLAGRSNHWTTGDPMVKKCKVWLFDWNRIARSHSQAGLARERERHLTTARAEQIPKYGQIRTESRLFRAPPVVIWRSRPVAK